MNAEDIFTVALIAAYRKLRDIAHKLKKLYLMLDNKRHEFIHYAVKLEHTFIDLFYQVYKTTSPLKTNFIFQVEQAVKEDEEIMKTHLSLN